MNKRKASGIIFYDDKGNILIQDRRAISKWGEEYGFFGGGMEEGENWEQTLKREIKEELGLELKEYKLFKHSYYIFTEANLEIEYWVSIAKMPDMSKLKVEEGKLALIPSGKIKELKMLKEDYNVVNELISYLKQKEHMKTILVDGVKCFVSEDGTIFEEMYRLLEEFPNRKIILTGANDEQFKGFGLDKIPYEVFTLKHNPEKTDPEYYKLMLKHFNLNKDQVIYFENNPEAVKSAESAGIRTHHYDPEKKDLKSLKKFLKANL